MKFYSMATCWRKKIEEVVLDKGERFPHKLKEANYAGDCEHRTKETRPDY